MSDTRLMVEHIAMLGPGGGEQIDALAEFGYELDSVEQRDGQFVAQATKTIAGVPYRAAAVGRTRIDAARALVKTIARR